MGVFLMGAFLLLGSIQILFVTTAKTMELKEKDTSKKMYEANKQETVIKTLITARGNFVRIYGRYPTGVSELVSSGFLDSTFTTSYYGKDLILNSDGSISALKDADNALNNSFLLSNEASLKSIKNINNTDALKEQKNRFNSLKTNEKSITIGNDVNLSKQSSSYTSPNLDSTNSNSTTSIKGW